MRRLIFAGLMASGLPLIAGAGKALAEDAETRKQRIEARAVNTSEEALRRKKRSVERLRAEGVPVIEHLPVIETEAESTRRSSDAVAERAVALAICAVKGETGDQELTEGLIEQFGAEEFLTPDERVFIEDESPTHHERVQFSWRYEAVYTLLWALGVADDLGRPDHIVDVPWMAGAMRELGTEGLKANGRLRPQAEILDAADLIYRYHWATRDAELNGRDAPAGLESGVVQERHHALNWLIGYLDQEWDEISTDT